MNLHGVANREGVVLDLHLRNAGLEEVVEDDSRVALHGRRKGILLVRVLVRTRAPVEEPRAVLPVKDRLRLLDEARGEGGRERTRLDRVERGAVGAHDGVHVLGLAGAALDLERGDARGDELVEERQGAEVLGGEDGVRRHLEFRVRVVDRLAVLVHIAVHGLDEEAPAAGLVAGAAVRAAPVRLVREEAAPRLGHALRAVDERLDLDARRACDLAHLPERTLAGEDDARGALLLQEARGKGIGTAHLRGDVERRAVLPAKGDHAPVRDDEGVDEGLREDDQTLHGGKFALEDNRVERKVELHAARAAAPGRLGQRFAREVDA